jgi:AcrR family transcriptional regulator
MQAIPSRREQKKDATRRRIIETGVRIFSERGIEAATVDEIAAAADVGKGTIYNYFATKEDIVVAFMVEIEKKIQQQALRLSRSSQPLEHVLTEFVTFHLRSKEKYHGFVRVFLGQLFTARDDFRLRIVEMQATVDPPLEMLFGRLRERGLIRQNLPLARLMLIFKTMQLGLTAVWAVEGPPWKQTYELARHEVKLFCHGLAKGGPK